MKLQHRHIIGIGLLYVFLLGFASCANESFDLPCGEAEENSIYLTFHTAVAGVFTRANETPDDARINQLLVVIVSENSAPEEGNSSTYLYLTPTHLWVCKPRLQRGCRRQ